MSKLGSKIADRYDRVASSAPINGDAARTFGMKGEAEPDLNIPPHMEHWEAPPKTVQPPADKAHRIGKKYGKLTVMGYLGSGKRASKWLVRCLCGRYESRIGKAVERAVADDECLRCRKLSQLQRNTRRWAYFDRFGTWPNE